MSRYIRYKYQKQQINYLNCNDLDKWIDTCQTRLTGFDSICSGSCNCTTYGNDESEVIYSYKKLNPNYSYDCLDGNRYYKLQKQVSYDGGLTYVDMDEYKTGDLYESNSPFCSAETVLMDWFESDNYCVGTDLYKREVKRVSFDGGNTWSDMGYTDENGVTTYEYRTSKIESNSCDCIKTCDTLSFEFAGDTTTYYLNGTIYTATSSPYSTTLTELGIDTLTSFTFEESSIIKLISFPDTSNITDMSYRFYYCTSLIELDLSSFNTSNVVSMHHMFNNCYYLKTLNVSGWDVSKVGYKHNMFTNCNSLNRLILGEVTQEQYDWWCARLTEAELTCNIIECTIIGKTLSFEFTGSSVTYNLYQGSGARKYFTATTSPYNVTMSDLGITDIKDCYICDTNITKINSLFQTENTIQIMFTNCTKLNSINLSCLNTSNFTDMGSMFNGCESLTSLNVSNFNTSNVTDMSWMFSECKSLTSLDLSNFNTSNVTNMCSMFIGCSSLTSLDLSNFVTSNVTDMVQMFHSCSGLTSLVLSGWNTSNVTEMGMMFYNCKTLTSLDLSGWNTSKVTNMNAIFYGCLSLQKLNLSGWDMSKVKTTSFDSIYYKPFTNCNNLTIIYAYGCNTSTINLLNKYKPSNCTLVY